MVIKIYTFKGNLKECGGSVETQVHEANFNLAIGLWEISVDSCFINIKELLKSTQLISITSNLLHHQEVVQGENTNVQTIIGSFKLSRNKYLATKQCVIESTKRHFISIENCSNKIILTFADMSTKEKLKIDCDVYLSVCFHRVE